MIIRFFYISLLLQVALPLPAQEEKGWPFPDSATRRQHGVKTMAVWWVHPLNDSLSTGEVLEYNRQGQPVQVKQYLTPGKPPLLSRFYYDARHRPVRLVWGRSATDSTITLLAYDDEAHTCIETYLVNDYDRRSRIRYYNHKGQLLREEDRQGGDITFAREYTYRKHRIETEKWLQPYDTTILRYRYTHNGLLYWKQTMRSQNEHLDFPKHYYDPEDRLIKTVSGSGADTSVMRQYWQNGLPVKQVYTSLQTGKNETEIIYNKAGLPGAVVNRQLIPGQDSIYFEYSYDDAGRPVQKMFCNRSGPAYFFQYQYNAEGRLIRETHKQVSDSNALKVTLHTYDEQGRLLTTSLIGRAAPEFDGLKPRYSPHRLDTVVTRFEYANHRLHREYLVRNRYDADCYLNYGRHQYPNRILEDFNGRGRQHLPCGFFLKITDTIAKEHSNGITKLQLRVGVCVEVSYNDSLPKTWRLRTVWMKNGQLQRLEDRDSTGQLLTIVEPRGDRYAVTELAATWKWNETMAIKTAIQSPLLSFAADSIYYDATGHLLRHTRYYGWPDNGRSPMSTDTVHTWRNGLLAASEISNSQGYRQVIRYEYNEQRQLLAEKHYAGGDMYYHMRYVYRNGRLHRIYTGLPEKVSTQRIEYTYY